MDHPSAPT